jgi:F-type H+/Na+-transporting ATPase subunit alpha
VLRFERELLDHLRRNTSILDTLRETNVLDDDTVSALDEAVDEFKKGFQTGEGKPLASVGKESFEAAERDDVEQAQITRNRR